jgi:hypothetical protein
LDAVCLLIAAIVVLDTLGSVARGGAQAVFWLARVAFGRYAGALVALVYSVETPIWVGGSLAITAVAVVDELIVPLRVGMRVPLAGAAAQVALLGFCTPTVGLYGVHGLAAADLARPGRCSWWSRRCWSTTSSASSCPRRRPRSYATRSATCPPRSCGRGR